MAHFILTLPLHQLNQVAATVPLMRTNQNIPNGDAPACADGFASGAPELLDVVVVSTLRPELLDLTLHSFHKFFLHQFKATRLILNVDPIGEPRTKQEELLAIAHRYSNLVISPWTFEYYGKPREAAYVIDTGKKWRRAHQLQKQNADGKTGTFWNPATTAPFIATAFHRLKYKLFLAYWRRRVGCPT